MITNISKKAFKEFFSYSRSELRGIIILALLILILIILKIYIASRDNKMQFIYKSSEPEINNLDHVIVTKEKNDLKNIPEINEVKLVAFDPNTAEYNEFLYLGLNDPIIRKIINYRKKGGRFKKPDDLLKIYGIDTNMFNTLKPFIAIKNLDEIIVFQKNRVNTSHVLKIDINAADSTELKKIPGIGPVLSRRIFNYRQILGGFINSYQLKEVFGINDSILINIGQYLIIDTNQIVQINLNTCTLKDLERHPYIDHYQAKAIESYRRFAGPFSEKRQLLDNYLLNEENYLKIAPYLRLH